MAQAQLLTDLLQMLMAQPTANEPVAQAMAQMAGVPIAQHQGNPLQAAQRSAGGYNETWRQPMPMPQARPVRPKLPRGRPMPGPTRPMRRPMGDEQFFNMPMPTLPTGPDPRAQRHTSPPSATLPPGLAGFAPLSMPKKTKKAQY